MARRPNNERQRLIDYVEAGGTTAMLMDGMLVLTVASDRVVLCGDCPHLHVVLLQDASPPELEKFLQWLNTVVTQLASTPPEVTH